MSRCFDVPLNQSFAQTKSFDRVILYPEERIRVNLEDYFRGSLLDYQLDVYLESPQASYDESLVTIVQPLNLMHEYDFPQFDGQRSLAQSSVVYQDRFGGLYLIFIDFNMHLHIYNISNFMYPDTNYAIQLISETDIYKDINLSPDKSCTNLIILEEARLLANCKSKIKMQKSSNPRLDNEVMGLSVLIDISSMTAPSVRFFKNGNDFLSMKDGEYRFLKKIDFTYLMLVKKYKTFCYFSVLSMDMILEPKTLIQIYAFDDPSYYDTKDLKDFYDQTYVPIKPELAQSHCQQTAAIDMKADRMEYLQIQDIDILHQHNDIIVATDYNYGIFFMNITCSNLTACSYYPQYLIRDQGIGKMFVLDRESSLDYQVMFVQKLSPPGVLEINIDNIESPFIQRQYYLMEDGSNFISIDIIAANQKYIITQFMSLQDMKPVMRVIRRDMLRFSTGLTEFKYADFFDSGVSINFLSPFEDFFLMKTSDVFQIYKIQEVYLSINAVDYNKMKSLNLLDSSIDIKLSAIDSSTYNQISTTFNIKFLSEELNNKTYFKYQGTKRDQNTQVNATFSCGSDIYQSVNFTQYFDGPQSATFEMKLADLSQEDYFEIIQERQSEQRVYVYDVESCYLATVLSLRSFVNSTDKKVVACMLYKQSNLNIIDAFEERQDGRVLTLEDFYLPEASIVEFENDFELGLLFVMSDRNTEGQQGAVFHIFQQFNRFAWVASIDINEKFPQQDRLFLAKAQNSLSYDQERKRGVLISDHYIRDNQYCYKQLIWQLERTLNGYDLSIVAMVETQLPLNDKKKSLVDLIQTKINSLGLWIVLTNNTLRLFQPVELGFHQSGFKSQNSDFTAAFMLKKQFNYTIKEFENSSIRNFRSVNDLFALFYGDDGVAIVRYFPRMFEFQFIMMLPLYQSDNKIYHSDKISYKFVSNSFLNIVESDVSGNFIYFVCSRFINSTIFDGYYIFGFDITENRHQIIKLKERLNLTQDMVDEMYFNLRVVDGTSNSVRILISLSRDYMMIYKVNRTQAIYVKDDEKIQIAFVKACTKQDLALTYKVNPIGFPTEVMNLNILVKSQGQVVRIDDSDAEITISKETSSANFSPESLYGRYSLTQNIHGQDLDVKMKCIEGEVNITEVDFTFNEQQARNDRNYKCSNLAISSGSIVAQETLEFLGSSIQLLGFFVVEPAILFLNEYSLDAIIPQTNDKVRYNRFKSTKATFFFMKKIEVNQTTSYYLLINQYEDQSFCLNYFFSAQSFNLSTLNEEQYLIILDLIYVLKYDFLEYLTLNITMSEIYVRNNSLTETVLIFVHDLPQISFQSRLSFYKTYRNPETEEMFYTKIDDKLVSIYSWDINSFKVNSIGVNSKDPILYLGVENFGLLILNLESMKIIKMQSIQSVVGFHTQFKISQIIFESHHTIYLAVDNYGLLSLKFDFAQLYKQLKETQQITKDLKEWETTDLQILLQSDSLQLPEPRYVTHLRYSSETKVTGKNYVAKSSFGFAYLESREIFKDMGETATISSVRFINYYATEDSKSLGIVDLIENDECNFIETIPYALAQPSFSQDISKGEYFVVATVCQNSQFKLVAFNYHPQIVIKVPQNNTFIEYQQQVKLSIRNQDLTIADIKDENYMSTNVSEDLSEDDSFTYQMLLTIDVLNNERKVDMLVYIIFILGLSMLLIYLNKLIRAQVKSSQGKSSTTKSSKSQFQKRKSNLSGVGSESPKKSFFRSLFKRGSELSSNKNLSKAGYMVMTEGDGGEIYDINQTQSAYQMTTRSPSQSIYQS